MYFEKIPGAKEAICDFLFPKYPGLPGYPGYKIDDMGLPESGLNPTKYDRIYVKQSDQKFRHFYQGDFNQLRADLTKFNWIIEKIRHWINKLKME